MGVQTGRESTGPIRHFPSGFWAQFNLWWHGEYARSGCRPSSKSIIQWHAQNAVNVWGDQAVSYQETQRHANRMKCRRTGQHVQRQAYLDEDDEEEDYTPESFYMDLPGRGTEASAHPISEDARTEVSELPMEGNGGSHPPDRKSQATTTPPLTAQFNFGAYSDPPGALCRYLHADSDIPEPAAPPGGSLASAFPLSCSYLDFQTGSAPLWMQPDPTVLPGAGVHGEGISSHRFMDSSASVFTCVSEKATTCCQDSVPASQPGSSSDGLRVKRGRDVTPGSLKPREARSIALAKASCGPVASQQPEAWTLRRANPFADVAKAAAAAAMLPTAQAHVALSLLNQAAEKAAPRPGLQSCASRMEPEWLNRAAEELNTLMRDMGLLAADGNALELPELVGRPRALCSTQPLTLPNAPIRRMNLDTLMHWSDQ